MQIGGDRSYRFRLRRSFAAMLVLLYMLIWCLTMLIYLRSKYRADDVAIITRSHTCLELFSDLGELELSVSSPWPNQPQVLWNTAPQWFPHEAQVWESKTLWAPRRPDHMISSSRREWHDFSYGFGTYEVLCEDRFGPAIEYPYYQIHNSLGTAIPFRQQGYWLAVPTWAVPSLPSFLPILWLTWQGVKRGRKRERKRGRERKRVRS